MSPSDLPMPDRLPPLLSLPPELLTHLLSLLLPDPHSYHTLLSLRSTHPLFTILLPPPLIKSQHTRLSTLYFASEVSLIVSPRNHHPSHAPDVWPCYICLHQLPRSNFAHTQTHAGKSIGHAKARMRFCFDCGIRKQLYAVGTVMRCFQGPDRVLCRGCGELGVAAKRRTGRNPNLRIEGIERKSQLLDHGVKDGVAFWVTDVRGLCVECAGKLKAKEDVGVDDELADAGHLEHAAIEVQASTPVCVTGQPSLGKGTSERKGRCQRCWSIDHTERPAQRSQGNQLLCHECWIQVWV